MGHLLKQLAKALHTSKLQSTEKLSTYYYSVLYVPNLAGSLISVLQLQDRGILTRTTKQGELFLELDGKTIARAVRLGKTYTLASTEESDSAYRATVEDENLTWH